MSDTSRACDMSCVILFTLVLRLPLFPERGFLVSDIGVVSNCNIFS